MTRIRARCPGCGDVEFGIDSIVVMSASTESASYRFQCPECADSVERSAVPEVLELLMSAGVRCEQGRRCSIDLPPLTERDLQEFEAMLSQPDWFASLESTLRKDNL
jgi:hypothetical protein